MANTRRRRVIRVGKYRSKFEHTLSKIVPKRFEYEPARFPYTYQAKSTYCPDWAYKNVWLEAKGYFRTYSEARKYLCIREAYPDIVLLFVFADPYKAMVGSRKKKDGTRQTMADWADKNGFQWCTPDTLLSKLKEIA